MQDALQNFVRYGRIFLDETGRLGQRDLGLAVPSAKIELVFKFNYHALDSVHSADDPIVKQVYDKIDSTDDYKKCRDIVQEFYSTHIQRSYLELNIPDIGNCRIMCSGKLGGEIGKCIAKTFGRSGLQAGRRVSKQMVAALASLQTIVKNGTASAFVQSNHKKNDTSMYSRIFNVVKGRFPFSAIFTIKKGSNGEISSYHLNTEGNYSFKVAMVEYLENVVQTDSGISFTGSIKTLL